MLYAANSSPDTEVAAWSLYDGTSDETYEVTGEAVPPYGTVLDAMRDGWRVIKYPDLRPPSPAKSTTSPTWSSNSYWKSWSRSMVNHNGSSPDLRLTSREMARFVRDGLLRFDHLVPRDLCAEAAPCPRACRWLIATATCSSCASTRRCASSG